MKIKFNYITIRNLLSFGNNITKFKLNKSPFSLIVGENGSGKSSLIVDALHFALFGKIIRKGIKLAQVVNNINKKNCEVSVEFEINGTTYLIERGLAPDYLHFYRNEGNGNVLVDERASKVLIQKEIETLLQFDQTTFKNICILSLNNNKPFVDLTPEESRTVVENLLGIQIYSQMLDNAKAILKEHKDKLKILEKDQELYKQLVEENNGKIEKIKTLKENFEVNKNKAIEVYKEEMSVFIESYKEHKNRVKTIVAPTRPDFKEIDEKLEILYIEKDACGEIINNLRSRFSVIIDSKDKALDKRKFFSETDKCPICDSELTEKHKTDEINKLSEEIEKYKDEKLEIESKINIEREEVKKIENNISELKAEKTVLSEDYVEKGLEYEKERKEQEHIKIMIEKLKEKISSLKDKIEEKKKETLSHVDDVVDMKMVEEYNKKFADISADVIKTKEEIYYYDFIKELLSDEGIKAQVIKNDLPFLNKTINEYLKDFERTYTVKFDEQFNLTMGGYSKRGLSYFNLSEGEKKRIDIAILLSFVRLARQKNSISCNILVFDELLETSLDEEGKQILVNNLLTNMIKSGIIDNILVISHNKQLVLPDAQKITVYKEGEFSKVVEE